MDFEAEIHNYISSKEHNGALLVTGKWGCGKTFTLKRVRDSYNEKGKFVIAMVSLFGIDSTELLAKKVKETVFFAQTSKTKEKSQRIIRHFLQNITATLSEFREYSDIVKGIYTALSVNLYDWVIVEKKVIQYSKDIKKNDPIKLPLVLIFDDFERCGIDIMDLLGSINEYTENREIKTIIVADEDKIGNEKYTEFKEKVICRTIKLSPNFPEIIGSIISNYQESEEGYRQFLTDNKDVIIAAFKESECNNLRTLKSMMVDFERIYAIRKNSQIPMKFERHIFYQFCVVTAEYKAGNYIKSGENTYELKASESFKANDTGANKTDIFSANAEQAIKKKYNFGIFNDIPTSISRWIVEGIWDKKFYEDEIEKLYGESKRNLDEKFLNNYFWSLNQEIIEGGFPVTLERAYNGNLCCDELLSLLKREHLIKDSGGKLPCEIDYSRIEKAFDERIKKIRSGIIQEPTRRTFVHNEDVDNQAISIIEKIERWYSKEMAWNNYKNFISYLEGDNQISRHEIENSIIDVFDSKLLNLFIQRYQESKNHQKRELAQALIKVSVSNQVYSSDEDITTSLDNLNLLLNKLDVLIQNEKDQMTCIITNEFKKFLKDKVSYITTQLHPHEPQKAL